MGTSSFHRLRYGLRPILCLGVICLLFLALSRLALSFWQWDEIPAGGLFHILLQGLRVDFLIVCAFLGIPALFLALFSLLPWKLPLQILLWLFVPFIAIGMTFIAMNEFATWGFLNEFGVRPNNLYVDYLKYPSEVFATIWHGHKLAFFCSVIGLLLSFIASWKLTSYLVSGYKRAGLRYNIIAAVLTVVIVPLGIRSSFQSSPMNPYMVCFADNNTANSLPLNSTYSAIYAFNHMNTAKDFSKVEVNTGAFYSLVDPEQILAAAHSFNAYTKGDLASEECPLTQKILPFVGLYDGTKGTEEISESERIVDHKPYNVVIIMEESLGDNQVASQGGAPVTPNLELLRKEGWWFNNMYAAGFHSDRGIEAITASFPPSAMQSIDKLPSPKVPFATIFRVLKEAGYTTSFIYPGDSNFDNMKEFFYSNGIDVVIDQLNDFTHAEYTGPWGVSDEDLFNRAHVLFNEYQDQGKTFCSILFTSSNHDPYLFPKNKVSLPESITTDAPGPYLGPLYADYALGSFFKKAKAEGRYYNETLFLVIADHEAHKKRSGKFPLHDSTIPAVIIGPNVQPHDDDRQVSQMDMGITLLSLAGIEGEIPAVGQNMTRADAKSRSIMQFTDSFGYLKGENFISLNPYSEPKMYKVHNGEQLEDVQTMDQDMLKEAIGLSNLGLYLYRSDASRINCMKITTSVTATKEATQIKE